MNAQFALPSVDISAFRRSPAKAIREAGARPLVVMSDNQPAFYVVSPRLFEALVDRLEDDELAELAAARLACGEDSILVSLESL